MQKTIHVISFIIGKGLLAIFMFSVVALFGCKPSINADANISEYGDLKLEQNGKDLVIYQTKDWPDQIYVICDWVGLKNTWHEGRLLQNDGSGDKKYPKKVKLCSVDGTVLNNKFIKKINVRLSQGAY